MLDICRCSLSDLLQDHNRIDGPVVEFTIQRVTAKLAQTQTILYTWKNFTDQ
jgi:hypothetical protein